MWGKTERRTFPLLVEDAASLEAFGRSNAGTMFALNSAIGCLRGKNVKVGQKLEYACRVAIQLAKNYNKGGVSRVEDLARIEAISPNFLVQILNDLRRGGVVTSKRGKLGGYMLAKAPVEISLADIARSIEGEMLAIDSDRRGESGDRVADIWKSMAHFLEGKAAALSLGEMVSGEDTLEYHI